MKRLTCLGFAFVCFAVSAAHATDPTNQPPDRGGFTRALGMPLRVQQTGGLEYLVYRPAENAENGGLFNIGVQQIIGNPVVGLAGLGLELYVGGRSRDFDGGARGYFTIPALLLGLGVD